MPTKNINPLEGSVDVTPKGPPAPPPVEPPGGGDSGSGGGSSGGGSSSGGSSSGGSSSSSSSPPVDPVIATKVSAFGSLYMQLWGEPATRAYLEAAAKDGMNVWEFEERERHKPAFRKTNTYRDEGSSLAELLHNLGVV